MKFFLLLHIKKKNYFNLSPVCISKLHCKEEFVQRFVVYGDIKRNTDNRQNMVSYWKGGRGKKI